MPTRAVATERYFESGDELLVYARHVRLSIGNDTCQDGYYVFYGNYSYKRVWVIDAAKGKEGDKGLFFIDENGIPYSAEAEFIKIIRSGKRNMASTPVGSITTLANPVRYLAGKDSLVFDTAVIAASAARFKDFWRVDSTTYAKDTTVIGKRRVDSSLRQLSPINNFSLFNRKTKRGSRRLFDDPAYTGFEASSYDKGSNNEDFERKSWMLFDVSQIPKGAVIKHAELNLNGHGQYPHENRRTSNSTYIQRGTGRWIGESLSMTTPGNSKDRIMTQYFYETGLGAIDISSRVTLGQTASGVSEKSPATVSITALMQGMVNDYYTNGTDASIMIRLIDPGGVSNGQWSRRSFANGFADAAACGTTSSKVLCKPFITLEYYMPCVDSSSPSYSSTPVPGYYCYSNPKDSFLCKPNIVDSAVNPYRWGILGNWRMDRAYTYYARRKQSDPLVETNIRRDGEIKDFNVYWTFASKAILPSSDSTRWVWNSEITLFNHKGFEIENHDPLERYNSGQYGYNQTLPVAVAQNSRNRNMMFDGFEDYGYRTDTCKKCPSVRFIDLTTGGGTRVDTMSHSGNYSMRIAGNSTASVPIQIVSPAADSVVPAVSIDVDSALKVYTTILQEGTGITGFYFGQYSVPCHTRVDPTINFNWETASPMPGCPINWFEVTWKGKVLPVQTDYYTFYTNSDDGSGLLIKINGVWQKLIEQTNDHYRDGDGPNDGKASYPVLLEAGKLYEIEVLHKEKKERAKMSLSWSSGSFSRRIIPQAQLYPFGTTATEANIITDSVWCIRLKNPKPIAVTNNRFSPIAGTKVLVSAWVRENAVCTGSSYTGVSMQLNFNAGSPSSFTLNPKGPIIEGWQRIEDTLTIPANATSVNLVMRATTSTAAFFDDIRIHPFNSNMKSFVYSPVNIRLMAELNENNYATFYEYDDDGTLIRVKKETERGIKTIKETRSALLKE